MKKCFKLLLLFTAFIVCLGGKGPGNAEAATVYLNKTSITLKYKQSYTLKLKTVTRK